MLNNGDARLIFNGATGHLKFFLYGEGVPRHMWQARDVGIGDRYITAGEDEYGHYCKAPPGIDFPLGVPMACGPNSNDGQAYGWWAIPINDNAQGVFAVHKRAGLMLHGGGSASPDPFDPHQTALYDTLGCIRMWNADIGMETPAPGSLVYSVQYIQRNKGMCWLNICWP